MSLDLPEPLRWLAWVAGASWPDGDEDKMWAVSRGWKEASEGLEKLIPGIQDAKSAALAAITSGDARDQIGTLFDVFLSGDQSLATLAESYKGVSDSANDVGTELQSGKLNIIISLAVLALEIAWAWMFPPTAPSVEAAAVTTTRSLVKFLSDSLQNALERAWAKLGFATRAEINGAAGTASRYWIKHILSPATWQSLKGQSWKFAAKTLLPSAKGMGVYTLKFGEGAVLSGGLNAIVQGVQIGQGHRKSFNWTEFGASLAGTAAGTLPAREVGRYMGFGFSKLDNALGHGLTNAPFRAGFLGTGVLVGATAGTVSTLFGAIGAGLVVGDVGGALSSPTSWVGGAARGGLVGGARGVSTKTTSITANDPRRGLWMAKKGLFAPSKTAPPRGSNALVPRGPNGQPVPANNAVPGGVVAAANPPAAPANNGGNAVGGGRPAPPPAVMAGANGGGPNPGNRPQVGGGVVANDGTGVPPVRPQPGGVVANDGTGAPPIRPQGVPGGNAAGPQGNPRGNPFTPIDGGGQRGGAPRGPIGMAVTTDGDTAVGVGPRPVRPLFEPAPVNPSSRIPPRLQNTLFGDGDGGDGTAPRPSGSNTGDVAGPSRSGGAAPDTNGAGPSRAPVVGQANNNGRPTNFSRPLPPPSVSGHQDGDGAAPAPAQNHGAPQRNPGDPQGAPGNQPAPGRRFGPPPHPPLPPVPDGTQPGPVRNIPPMPGPPPTGPLPPVPRNPNDPNYMVPQRPAPRPPGGGGAAPVPPVPPAVPGGNPAGGGVGNVNVGDGTLLFGPGKDLRGKTRPKREPEIEPLPGFFEDPEAPTVDDWIAAINEAELSRKAVDDPPDDGEPSPDKPFEL